MKECRKHGIVEGIRAWDPDIGDTHICEKCYAEFCKQIYKKVKEVSSKICITDKIEVTEKR